MAELNACTDPSRARKRTLMQIVLKRAWSHEFDFWLVASPLRWVSVVAFAKRLG
jgi:hypothetical protein